MCSSWGWRKTACSGLRGHDLGQDHADHSWGLSYMAGGDFATPWTVAHQASLSMGFSRQEYWSGLPFLSPGDLPDPGIKARSSTLQANSLPLELPRKQVLQAGQHKKPCSSMKTKGISLLFLPDLIFLSILSFWIVEEKITLFWCPLCNWEVSTFSLG